MASLPKKCFALLLCWTMFAVGCLEAARSRDIPRGRKILVFGGNGFLGADAVERFINHGDNVTMVNRGNWYWDSYDRIRPYVTHISCDRKNGVESCAELVELVENTDSFDAVVDFSAYEGNDTRDSLALLKGKVRLYVMISTDSVYDVCDKTHDELTKESDSVRPETEDERKLRASYFNYGHHKLNAEEELIALRETDTGVPYVILRLPDVIGPRDSTHRWWLYQLWVQLESHFADKPISMPPFLTDYKISLVYSADVANVIFNTVSMDDPPIDHAYNLAFPEAYLTKDVINSIRRVLGVPETDIAEEQDQSKTLFVYPSVRKGPLDVTKAQEQLGWTPTPWDTAVTETVEFFEQAMKSDAYSTQRDEIIQILVVQLFKEEKEAVYSGLEKVYNITLNHFRPREEL